MTTAPARAIGRVTEVSLRDPALLAFLIVIGAIVPAVLALATGLANPAQRRLVLQVDCATRIRNRRRAPRRGLAVFRSGTDPGDVTGPVASGGHELAWIVGLLFSVLALVAAYDLGRSFLRPPTQRW